MSLVLSNRRQRAIRGIPRFGIFTGVFLVCASLLGFAAHGWAPRSLLAPRVVQGSAAAGYRYYLVGNPEDVVTPTQPGLVLEGGGTDIDESFLWMIDRSGGGDFLIIRTTGTDAYNNDIFDMKTALGTRVDSVATLVVESREASFDPFVARTIRSAEALWIAGGDQALHHSRWRGTPVGEAIHDLVARGVPIGGTSSGLAVMGEYTYTSEDDSPEQPHLTSSQALSDPRHPRLRIRGDFLHLPFLDGSILEPHFVQESRYGRMAVFLGRIADEVADREPRGIGIDRRTALLVEPDGAARVITHPGHPLGKVILFRGDKTAGVIKGFEFRRGDTINLSHWEANCGIPFDLSIEGTVLKTTYVIK